MIRLRTLCWLSILSISLTTTAHGASLRDRFAAADAAANDKKLDEAIRLFTEIGDDAKLSVDDRLRAYIKVAESERALTRLDNAIATYGKILQLNIDDGRRKDMIMTAASINYSAGHLDVAVATLEEMAAKYADDEEVNIDTRLTAAGYLMQAKKPADAATRYAEAIKHMDAEDPRLPTTLWNLSQAQWASDQFEASLQTARKLSDARFNQFPRWASREVHDRIVAALNKLKKTEEAITQYREWEKSDPSDVWRQRWALRAAQAIQSNGNNGAALAAYKDLFIKHAQTVSSEGWFDAQYFIVDRMIDAGDREGALKAAHVLLDVASDTGAINMAVQKIADLLQKIDGNKARARDFVAFQLYGPNGKDGAAGTPDDVKDPLIAIGYPLDPDREKAFADAFAIVGDDATAMYHRARLCIFIGRPKEAGTLYIEALKRANTEDWPMFATGFVMNGLRGARGTGVGTEAAGRYLLYGPAGADGVLKTDDDLTDPSIGLSAPSQWPLPATSPEDRQSIAALQTSLRSMSLDASLPGPLRRSAIKALTRSDEALVHTPDPAPYFEFVTDTDRDVAEASLTMALNGTRVNEIHLGSLRQLVAANTLPPMVLKKAQAEIDKLSKSVNSLTAKNAGVPKVPPIK